MEQLPLPASWGTPLGTFDAVPGDDGAGRHWRSEARYAQNLAQRVRSELRITQQWTSQVRAEQRFGTPLFDLCLEVNPLDPNLYWKDPHRPDTWDVIVPDRSAERSAEAWLPRGTLLEHTGWTGDQTEGFEVLTWRLVHGPIKGRSRLYVPLSARYGADGDLTRALIVHPEEPILDDPTRRATLWADLLRIADQEPQPWPTVPETIAKVGAWIEEEVARLDLRLPNGIEGIPLLPAPSLPAGPVSWSWGDAPRFLRCWADQGWSEVNIRLSVSASGEVRLVYDNRLAWDPLPDGFSPVLNRRGVFCEKGFNDEDFTPLAEEFMSLRET